MVGKHWHWLGMCVQVYGAALCGLAGMTKQVIFSIKAATGVLADIRQHEYVQVDVLPLKPAFRCSNEAALEPAARVRPVRRRC